MTALGIDIGGSSVKAALLREDKIISRGQSRRYQHPDADTLARAIREAVAPLDPPSAKPVTIGICMPGLFDAAARSITKSVNVPGLVGLNVDALVAAATGLAITPRVVSDALAAGTDAARAFGLSGRVLAISIGTGVGACVLDDGQPVILTGAGPGHIGQVDVTIHEPGRDVPIGPDGGRGGLEAYIGLPALTARYGPDVEGFLSARAGVDDPPLQALIRAIRIAHALYRMDHCLLLGGTGARLASLLESIKHRVDEGLTSLARPAWTLRCALHDHHAAAGAARLGLTGC